MTCPGTGLPVDTADVSLRPSATHTSPTNIAGLLWSVVAANELGLVTRATARRQCARTLTTLRGMDRHDVSGMYENWYDAATADPSPTYRRPAQPFVSSVDNGWLGAALLLVAEAGLGDGALDLAEGMDFTVFESPLDEHGPLHGGFWLRRTRRPSVPSRELGDGSTVQLTPHRYTMANSETRITELVALALGQRSELALDNLSAPRRTYLGREVVATWGGSMFEALAPAILVPEPEWAPDTWGANHATTVALHANHAESLGDPVWGFSPSMRPGGGYVEFGVPLIAAGAGYPSQWRGRSVITPHAAAIALTVCPEMAHRNLVELAAIPGAYASGGFVDSVMLGSRGARPADRYLSLDQAFMLGGLANVLTDAALTQGFQAPATASRVRPVVADPDWFVQPAVS